MEHNGMVFIMSGIPGSGKSYIARQMCESFSRFGNHYPSICSADDFFMVDGKYQFNPARISLAHQACFRKFIGIVSRPAFGKRRNIIMVDNTNLTAAEISPYYLAAETFNYQVEVLRIDAPMELAGIRQTHGVPLTSIEKMEMAFRKRDVMPWWKVRDVRINDAGSIINLGALPISI
jgi:tRNA uridine 5-carbamoylmethylation protein Kti12